MELLRSTQEPSPPLAVVGTVSLVSTETVCFSFLPMFTQPSAEARELHSVSENILQES